MTNNTITQLAALTTFLFVHFTDAISAASIVASKTLKAGNFEGVYAVAAGGAFVPGVQHTTLGVATDRSVAVIFSTNEIPQFSHAEEIVWKNENRAITIYDAEIVDADTAIEFLDSSLVLDTDADDFPFGAPEIAGLPTTI